MLSTESYKLFTSTEHHKIPLIPGTYAFFIRFPSISDYGIYRNKNYSDGRLTQLKRSVINDFRKLQDLLREDKFTTFLVNQKQAGLSIRYEGEVNRQINNGVLSQIEEVKPENICKFLDMLSAVSIFSVPLYVGITLRQSLRERIFQHKTDFRTRKQGTFGYRLSRSGLKWDQTHVAVLPYLAKTNDTAVLGGIEKILHQFSNPVFSIK